MRTSSAHSKTRFTMALSIRMSASTAREWIASDTPSVQISADKCFATRDTSWIGNSEKKGMCHILVNDERIRGWLDDDV